MAHLPMPQRSLSLIVLVGGVAAFAAFSPRAHTDVAHASAEVAPREPARDSGRPSWAAAAPEADAMDASDDEADSAPPIRGKVVEQLDVTKYSYLRLSVSGGAEVWAAVPATSSRVGETVTISNPERMTQFASTSLKRTFDEIFFGVLLEQAPGDGMADVANAFGAATADPHEGQMAPHPGPGKDADAVRITKSEKANGPLGRTVAEINALDQTAAGTRVRVRATVVKATSGVMGRTFLHLRDGTGIAPASHDLTATTTEELGVGAVVLLEGTVEVDRDFGSGYRYRVLLADARRVER